MPKKKSPYDCIKGSPILDNIDKMIPFNCFEEQRDWTKIAEEMDNWKEQYKNDIPEWDMRTKGYNWIYTKKEGKKRIYIE